VGRKYPIYKHGEQGSDPLTEVVFSATPSNI
jgi:hypothetical protein